MKINKSNIKFIGSEVNLIELGDNLCGGYFSSELKYPEDNLF